MKPYAILGLVALIWMAGCASLPIPHDQTNFKGIAELASSGVMAANTNALLRLFLIHGMADHATNWGEAYLKPLCKELGPSWSLAPASNHPVQWSDVSNTFVGQVEVYSFKTNAQTRIVAYQLTWSPLTEPFKTSRFQTDVALWCPTVNRVLRTVIDSNLSDVVLYLSGFDSNVLNKTVEIALTNFYHGNWDPEPKDTNAIPVSPVVIITESLGSVMLINALDDLAASAEQKGKVPTNLVSFLTNAQTIFMAANQLDLLEMPLAASTGQVPPAMPSNPAAKKGYMRTLFRLRHNAIHHPHHPLRNPVASETNNAPAEPDAKPLYVVAFNDPYDVLSFKVNTNDIGSFGSEIVIDNFAPRNAIDWFWLYESPAAAHDGYKNNPGVVGLMVKGYAKGHPAPQ